MAEKKKAKRVAKKEKNKNELQNKNDVKGKDKKFKKNGKMKFKYKHPKIMMLLRILLIIFLILCVIGAGVFIGLFYGLWGDDLEMDFEQLAMESNSVVVDSEGNILADLKGDESRKIISLEDMSEYLPKAYIAIEDERFEQHSGVDILRTGKAILTFITHGGKSSFGGSTITQQLVKNATNEDERSGIDGIIRKVKEWAKAYQIEQVMSKDQILETYLNTIFVGGQNHGVELGAEYYFNKSAKELSLAECAFLAGINSSPNYYNPYTHESDITERINKKAKTVLSKMLELKYISKEEYDTAVAEVDAGYKFENGTKNRSIFSSHTDALLAQVIAQIAEEKDISKDAAKDYLYTSGLTIYSTQVSDVQNIMEEEMKKSKYVITGKLKDKTTGEDQKSQAAMVIIEPSTGYVVGCVGELGEKTTSRTLNRATQTTRSAGSSFKPLADLIPGIEEGKVTPATIYNDKYTVFEGGYDPKNYNKYTTERTVRSAVTTSQNVPFVKVMAEVGNAKCREYLKKMGLSTIDDKHDTSLSLAIGGLYNGVKVIEMAAAYATIANDGEYIEPTFYTKVVDSNGKTVLEPDQTKTRAFSADTAYMVKDLLKSVVVDAGGTASYCKISGIDVAAKTGTTNGDVDRWLCGFTNYYAAATWYGYDEQEEVKYGNGNPAGRIWSAIMKEVHQGKEASKFEQTANIVTATVCRTSGLLATDKCTDKYSEIFIKGKLPTDCDAHQNEYTVCTETGLRANEYCPSTELRDVGYLWEKERLGLWRTDENPTMGERPTEYCTVHKKVEVTVPEKPTEPETPTKPDDSEEKPGDNTGDNSGGNKPGDNTGDNTGNNTGNNNGDNSGGNTGDNNGGNNSGNNTSKPGEGNNTNQ